MGTFITANIGSLAAAAGVNTEFRGVHPDGVYLEQVYNEALPLYKDDSEGSSGNTNQLVTLAKEIVSNICDLRNLSFSENLFPLKNKELCDLRRHLSEAKGIPNACIFSSVDMVIVNQLHAVPSTEDKVLMLAQYMHNREYYTRGCIDVHMVFHALRNSLLVLHPNESTRFLRDAHKRYTKGIGQFSDMLGAKAHKPDAIFLLEAPVTETMWATVKRECLPDTDGKIGYIYDDILKVDPIDPSSNQIGILSRVPFTVDRDLVPAEITRCKSDDDWGHIDLTALRAARAAVFVFDTSVHIAWHGRDTKNGDNHGMWMSEWVLSLYRAAVKKYPAHKVIISGDFNFMSFSAAAVAQNDLADEGYFCGNTSAPPMYGNKLEQVPSMQRVRSGLGTDQFSKIDVWNIWPKIGSVVRKDVAAQEPRVRLVAHTLMAAAVALLITGSWAASIVVALFTLSQSVKTHKRSFVAFLYGDAKRGTPGPTTPLDHLPLVMKITTVPLTSFFLWMNYAFGVFFSILVLLLA